MVQLIWIKRLVSETTRINTLIECNMLSRADLNRYRAVISAMDDFCAFVINSQNWNDSKNISRIVDEVEMVLFQHFYEQIDAFEDEEVHLDFSLEDENEINLRFKNPFIEDKSFGVIDEELYNNIGNLEDFFKGFMVEEQFSSPIVEEQFSSPIVEEQFSSPIVEEQFSRPTLEGDIIEFPKEIEFEISDEDSFLDIFDMKPGESREISMEEFIRIISQNQDELSFTLNPETFPDEADILSEEEEVSLEEFIAHLIDHSSKGMRFGILEDNDDLI